jgi:hypothetical protein
MLEEIVSTGETPLQYMARVMRDPEIPRPHGSSRAPERDMPVRAILAKTADQLFTHPLECICDAFFVFYSLWTLTWIVSYLANLSFSAISPIFFILPPLSVLALALRPAKTDQGTPIGASCSRRDTLSILVSVIAGVLLTLFLHRPDADDQMYLGMAVSLLANADQPIQQIPQQLPVYGSGFDANGLGFSAITAFEPFKAMISQTTGLPLLDTYYVLIPALMSALTVIVTCRLLRELVPDGWIIGMFFFFVVMLAWGDVHRTLANFGFVRMFQGKSVLVSAVVPALFLYVFLLLRDRTQTLYHSFLLAAAVISGVGFSRGGVIIAALVLLFLALASIQLDTLSKRQKKLLIITGVLVTVMLPFVYQNGWNLMNPSQLVQTSSGDVASTTNLEMVEFTMGNGLRGFFLLTCVGASFLFVKDERLRYSYRNFLAIFFLLLFIPWTSNFFAKTIQEYLSWRWLWILPVPVLASVAVGGAWARIREVSNSVVALGVLLALVIAFAAASPRLVLSRENYTSIRWPGPKLDGDSVYLRPYGKVATIKDGKLYLDGYESGF